MPSPVIPPDNVTGNTPSGHPDAHNNGADVLGLLAQALAQATGTGAAYPAGNAANIAQIQQYISTGRIITGTPLDGPSAATITVWQQPDRSLLVLPLSTYGLTGDDAFWINLALARLTAPGTPGPTIARLASGAIYTTASPVGLASFVVGTYLDLNQATIINTDNTAGNYILDMQGVLAGGYPANYPSGGAYDGHLVYAGTGTVGGLRYGGGQGFRFTGLRIASPGGLGIIEQNNQGWTEKTRLQAEVWFPGQAAFQYDAPGGTFQSHEYNHWDIVVHCARSVNGVLGTNGSYSSGSRLYLTGNMSESGPAGGAASCIDLSQSGGGNMSETFILVQVETTGSGGYNWQTIKFGTAGQMNNSSGTLRFNGANWNLSDATGAEFSFGGMIWESGSNAGLNAVNSKPSGWL